MRSIVPNHWHALRHAARRLRKAPAFSIASIGMLALGSGIAVAMFCTLSSVLLHGLPFPDSQRLVMLQADSASQHIEHANLSIAEAEQLATGTPLFDGLAYYTYWSDTVEADGQRPRDVTAQKISAAFFPVLGIKPLLGRALDADDVRLNRALAVISYDEWQRSFGGDARVIGRRLHLLDSAPLEIVGVMPPSIGVLTGDTAIWRPLSEADFPQDTKRRLGQRFLLMIGRTRSGASLPQVRDALKTQSSALRDGHGLDRSDWRITPRPLLDIVVGDVRFALWGAFALAALVLLIAAANVAILFDGRHTALQHEHAVMQAIGASRARIRRGHLLELGLIAAVAAALGIGLAQLAIVVLRELAHDSLPRVDAIVMDWNVVVFAWLLGIVAPIVAVLGGALRIDAEPNQAIRSGARNLAGKRQRRRLLPTVAMALSTVSLIAALGFGATLWHLQRVDPGFRADDVHALQIFRNSPPAQWGTFAEQILQRMAALPGAHAAAVTSSAPLSVIGPRSIEMQVLGRADVEPMQVAFRRVSPSYRAMLGIPLLAGRDFGDGDRAGGESVAIVNDAAAHRIFGDVSPLGRQISLPLNADERVTCRIVGIVGDIRNDGLRAPPAPEILVPFAQHPSVAMTFLLRSERRLAGIDGAMAEAVSAIAPQQSITRQYALADDLADQLRAARFFARTVGAFAAVALLLAMLGVYAVASLQQRRRVGEFGLRLAVGADPLALALDIVRDSVRDSAVGIVVGLVAAGFALWTARVLGVLDGDAFAPLGAGLIAMTAAAVLAAVLPAWRAARTDPMVALRND